MDRTQTHTRYQLSNSQQFDVNMKLFSVIREKNISTQERVKKIKRLLGKKPQTGINAQDGNDNGNTALHMAIERNELEVVNFLLSQGADTAIENGDGKTALQLAEECNHAEIIDTLKSCFAQVEWTASETERLASYTSQPIAANPNDVSVFNSNSHAGVTSKQTASTVLPPFSSELRVDKQLKLSNECFKQSIEKFYTIKQLSAIDQLKATPPYPTPHVMAQFASMAYRDCKQEDPNPPDGWQLLTTASHFGIKNSYFGTAYWHPEHQQVVIAHRGTDVKNFGALVTDFKGTFLNNYVEQMSSASTFANKVVEVLQEIETENKVSFELFFTGHSLGGWLAQITTFTTEYLEVKGGMFLKKLKRQFASSTVQDIHFRDGYHPHTVVFESPGCKDLLLQISYKLDVRLHRSSINLEHLDITNYLSAPNRINTCNTHLGTVYRIFTDLSDMGFYEKHTVLYNLATHSMTKIVEAFDPETGQVHKDDKGELRVLEVVDWPISSGLKGGEELRDFFKWAEDLNDYHPEIMDTVHSKLPKDYYPFRYQTKVYDECTKSLSTFTQDEREFLERYCSLRDVLEFFKPEDLFSVMSNAESENEAVRNLRNFKLDHERIRCPDASTLHHLIPYVKRLLRLFPNIKEKVKENLNLAQIRNRFYQHESQRYVEKIHQSALDFNAGALGLTEFLTSDQQIWQLRIIYGDSWTGITKVYRVLQNTSCTPNYSCESQHTILEIERLLAVNRMVNLNALLTSMETPHLLMIACGTNQTVNDELQHILRELFSILKQKNTMKIILATQSEGYTADFIQQIATETLGEGFISTDEQLTWSDLTASSQRKMLEKTVIFQGRSVALNQLTSAESMTDSFPLANLLHEKELIVGEEPVCSACSGYSEKYFIDRTFNYNIVVTHDISNDKREGKFDDLLASTELEFKELCQQNKTSNVHWLVEEESGELIWQQSQGDLKTLRKYTDAQKTYSYATSHLDKLLQQAKLQRVMIIADKAGMGKSTILTHLSKRIKQKFPAHWLFRIDLNDYTEPLKAQEGKTDKEWVLEFVTTKLLKLESPLEMELFKKGFEGNEISRVVVMVEGFDEIGANYKHTVLDMLKVLKQTSLEQLWVTTRPDLREELEDNLQQLSYTLQSFSEFEQVQFLEKFWTENLNLGDTNQDRLQIYAKALIRKLAQSFSDKDKAFTGIPLQTRMLPEAFEEGLRTFYMSDKSEPELPHKLDLLGLYRRFIDRKYDIYWERSKMPKGSVAAKELRQIFLKHMQEQHQRLALQALFTEDQLKFLQNDDDSAFSFEVLAGIGIVQRKSEGKPQFIDSNFADYFVAEFLINQLTKKTKPHPHVQDILLNGVLSRRDYQVTRSFLNGLLEKRKPSEEALKQCGELLNEQWNKRETHGNLTGVTTALRQAATEDNACIIGFIMDSLKSAEGLTILKEIILAVDDKGLPFWYIGGENRSVTALNKIWEWVEGVAPTH